MDGGCPIASSHFEARGEGGVHGACTVTIYFKIRFLMALGIFSDYPRWQPF